MKVAGRGILSEFIKLPYDFHHRPFVFVQPCEPLSGHRKIQYAGCNREIDDHTNSIGNRGH